jgi:hypothetical protein
MILSACLLGRVNVMIGAEAVFSQIKMVPGGKPARPWFGGCGMGAESRLVSARGLFNNDR